jgi:hypothetical protein
MGGLEKTSNSKEFADYDLLGFGGKAGNFNFGMSNTFGADLFTQFLNTNQPGNEMSSPSQVSKTKAGQGENTNPANQRTMNHQLYQNPILQTPTSQSEKLDIISNIGISNNLLESAIRKSEAGGQALAPDNSEM